MTTQRRRRPSATLADLSLETRLAFAARMADKQRALAQCPWCAERIGLGAYSIIRSERHEEQVVHQECEAGMRTAIEESHSAYIQTWGKE